MYEQEVLKTVSRTAPIARRAGSRRILLTAALPLALGACGLLSDATTPDDTAAARGALETPADLARAADSDIAAMSWLVSAAPEAAPPSPERASPAEAAASAAKAGSPDLAQAGEANAVTATPVAYLSSAPEPLPSEMRQLAAISDTDLEGMRGGFTLLNGITVNFGASIRSIARRVVEGVATPVFDVETTFSFDGGAGGATVSTAIDGGTPTVTTGVDPTAGIQTSAGDAAGTLVVHNVSTSQFNTIVQNVVDNTDATSVATLDFFLGGTIGAFTSEAATTQTSISGLLGNSLVNSLP